MDDETERGVYLMGSRVCSKCGRKGVSFEMHTPGEDLSSGRWCCGNLNLTHLDGFCTCGYKWSEMPTDSGDRE